MLVLVNVMVWCCSTSKKSADRRCASRDVSLVSMLSALMENTDDRSRLVSIQVDPALELLEPAADLGDEVPDRESWLPSVPCRSRRSGWRSGSWE
jgi:hypothetical protein